MNRYLVKATVVGALGGLLFGFDTAVIAGTTQQLTQVFHLDAKTLGFTVSIGLIGTIIGSMCSGWVGQKIGGREALRIMAILYTISAVACAFAWNWDSLMVGRLIAGIGIGGSSVLGPVYIAELAPAKWRGRMVGLFQINIVVGILLAYLSNYIVSLQHFGVNEWRIEFGVAILPSLFFLVMLYGIPRSSRWLVTTQRNSEALEVLRMMGSPNSEAELREIIDSVHREQGAPQESVFKRAYAMPIFLAISIGLLNQLTGINAILYYSNFIFAAAGFGKASAGLQTVLVGVFNLLATFVGMSLIDKLGRKTLLLIGSVGMVGALAGVAAIFFTNSHQSLLVVMLIVYILFFAISQGSVIWVYIAEIFPNRVRSKGQSIGTSSHWIANGIIAQFFPLVAQRSGGLPFAIFAGMMVVQFFLVLFMFPETKGVSLEEIQKKLGIV